MYAKFPIFVLGITIVNGAPGVSDLDPEILQICDIFCVNEIEVGFRIMALNVLKF